MIDSDSVDRCQISRVDKTQSCTRNFIVDMCRKLLFAKMLFNEYSFAYKKFAY